MAQQVDSQVRHWFNQHLVNQRVNQVRYIHSVVWLTIFIHRFTWSSSPSWLIISISFASIINFIQFIKPFINLLIFIIYIVFYYLSVQLIMIDDCITLN